MAAGPLSPEQATALRIRLIKGCSNFIGDGETAQHVIWLIFFGLTCFFYALAWSMKIKRHIYDGERIWFVQRVQRSRGTYWLPNGTIAFLLFHLVFTILAITSVASAMYRLNTTTFVQFAEILVRSFFFLPLIIGAWFCMTSQYISMAFMIEGMGNTSLNRFVMSPTFFHLFCYGTWFISSCILIPVGTITAVVQIRFYQTASKMVDAFSMIEAGGASADTQLAIVTNGMQLTATLDHLLRLSKISTWVEFALALAIDIFCIPSTFVLLYHFACSSRKAGNVTSTTLTPSNRHGATRPNRWFRRVTAQPIKSEYIFIGARTIFNTLFMNATVAMGLLSTSRSYINAKNSFRASYMGFLWIASISGLVVSASIAFQTVFAAKRSHENRRANPSGKGSRSSRPPTLSLLNIQVSIETARVASKEDEEDVILPTLLDRASIHALPKNALSRADSSGSEKAEKG